MTRHDLAHFARAEPAECGWAGCLAEPAISCEDQVAIEGPSGEPAVVGDSQHRAIEAHQSVLQRLGGDQIKVVGGLIEQQQIRSGQFQQQDLKTGLLPPGEDVETLICAVRELIAVEDPAGLLAGHPGPVLVTSVQNLQQGAPGQLRMLVGLGEGAGTNPGAEPGPAAVRHRRDRHVAHWLMFRLRVAAPRCQQPEEMGLTRTIGAEHGDPLAVPELQVKGLHQPGQRKVLADHGALAAAATPQAHPDVLLAGELLRRRSLLELAQSGLGGLITGGHAVVVGSLLLVHQHQSLQLRVLVIPAAAQLVQADEPIRARLPVRGERSAMDPCGVAGSAQLHRDDPIDDTGQEFAVVGDQQDCLGRVKQRPLQPQLARHVQVIVRLVEQEHLVAAAQQRLQRQALLFPAGQRAHLAPPRRIESDAQGRRTTLIPDHLHRVAAGVDVAGQRSGIPQLGGLVIDVHQGELGGLEIAHRQAQRRWGHRDEELMHRGGIPDTAHELRHDTQAARAGHRTGVRGELARDDPQQGGLTGAVRTDERDLAAFSHPESDLVEQDPPISQGKTHRVDVHIPHGGNYLIAARPPSTPFTGTETAFFILQITAS